MSTEPNPLFGNFQPAPAEQLPVGAGEAIANALVQSQPKNGRKKKKGAVKKAPVAIKVPADPKAREKKAVVRVAKVASSPKFDMLRILQATATLKEADMKMFESVATAFLAMGKPTRTRILPAIQKLFA